MAFNVFSRYVANVAINTLFLNLLGEGIPAVFIAIAGRSNGLGPVLSGNATWPVINCPPVTADWAAQDIWSSLRMPSGRKDHQIT